jgi:DNA phosphorothioation-associated DGQHR protein 1
MAHLFKGPAIRVRQPIGEFWIASIPASTLLKATAPDPLRLAVDPSMSKTALEWQKAGKLRGNQRPLEKSRLIEIAKYIGTVESTFPNSIILAAPTLGEEGTPESSAPWAIDGKPGADMGTLTIPSAPLLASVVDGQHRLYAFTQLSDADLLDTQLVCAVFFDLPIQMQAMVFATINTNQKAVRRGLALNMYGYNVEDEKRDHWSPEKLAVFMTRRLNFDANSPLYHRIKVEAVNAPPATLFPGAKRPIGMAAVVDGITGLVSRSAESDRDDLRKASLFAGVKRSDLRPDESPLREWFQATLDAELYSLLLGAFGAITEQLWSEADPILVRAVDVRGLMDFLGDVIKEAKSKRGEDPQELLKAVRLRWSGALATARNVNFAEPFFEATYRGRRRVQNALRLANRMARLEEMPPADRAEYERLVPKR